MNSSCLYVEIGQNALEALYEGHAVELPLAREETGRLTAACRETVVAGLRDFLKARGGRPRLRALVALGARGVSLRRLTLPSSNKEELQRLLLLQIESEFPLPPDQLAWGARAAGPGVQLPNGSPAREDLLVAAVKREVVEEYTELLSACGLTPEFTIGALARGCLCRPPTGSYAALEIGPIHSELISFEEGAPTAFRLLHWGEARLAKSIQEALGVSRDEAERLRTGLERTPPAVGPSGPAAQKAAESALDSLAAAIRGAWKGQTLFLGGNAVQAGYLVPALAERLGGQRCERIETGRSETRSTAILGLKATVEGNLTPPPLLLRIQQAKIGEARAKPAPWKWAAAALLLAIATMLLPAADALIEKPFLESRLAGLKAGRERLPEIDRELNFLQDLKQSQPPYLDVLTILAAAAPPGTSLESFSMGRKGDVSVHGKLSNAQQVVQFRAQLVDSGFFSEVTVEEQSPSPDRKVTVRISARLKPASERKPVSAEALAKVTPKPNEGGMPEQGGMPEGFAPPPGVSLPEGFTLPEGVVLPEGVGMPDPSGSAAGMRRSGARPRVRPAAGNPSSPVQSPSFPVSSGPGSPAPVPSGPVDQ